MRARLFALAALVSAATLPLHAQSAAPAAVGERVRIATLTRYGKFSYVGRVVSVHGDSVNVEVGGREGTQAIPFSAISSIDVSAGTETHGRAGMLYGGLIGGLGGALIGAATYDDSQNCHNGETYLCISPTGGRSLNTIAGLITGGLLGFAVGGIAGVSHRTERWIHRPLGSGARVGISPSRGGGTSVRLSVAF